MYKLKNALIELEELGVRVIVKTYTLDKDKRNSEIKAELAKSGGELVPEEDGLIAQGRNQKNFVLIVKMPKVSCLAAFTIQGDKAIQRLSNLSEKNEKEADYVKLVPTYEVWHGKSFSTKPHDNNVRVVSVKDGVFKKFEISIVTRIYQKETFFFLAVQKTYQAQLFEDSDGRVTVLDNQFPGYRNWPELQELVEEMLWDVFLGPLPPPLFPEDPEGDVEATVPLEENQGVVIFFNPRLGYGRAFTQKGVKHFSWENVADNVRFQHLERDDLISFESIEENAKGGQLIGVKHAKRQSRGVKPRKISRHSSRSRGKSTKEEVM